MEEDDKKLNALEFTEKISGSRKAKALGIPILVKVGNKLIFMNPDGTEKFLKDVEPPRTVPRKFKLS
ncbi:hypothetical protein [Leptospira ilyithenensis]|uniref:Uncharacterized protein n=1 Tax=Leptospira ilyithenensis TaxID=2484901 RepID=A0A4R9LPZ1_9LEPT|nr:hypothetical protein [Leptospira ilyithenensis]TGN09753.1 hypothetical protein EHS11_11770 [Leptospira ilyithenensis]